MKHMRTLRTNEEVLVETLGGLPATAQLYRTLSKQGNPGFRTLRRVLAAIGMRFTVAPAVRPPGQRTRRASRAV